MGIKTVIDAETLRIWLQSNKPVVVLDIRPMTQREEWSIPGSIHIDVYEKLKENKPDVFNGLTFPENTPIVTVCAQGFTSQIAADQLIEKGLEAYSLEGGMKGWSLSWNIAEIQEGDVTVIQVRRTGKGCLSYLIASNKEAAVIDASVDIEVYINLAKEKGWKIKYVLDTHIHADHVSRTQELAFATSAKFYLPEQDKTPFKFNTIHDGLIMKIGSSILQAIHTPGHTLESMVYKLNDEYLFTGDTLFLEGIGRPDLKADEDQTIKRASLLYKSLKKLTEINPQIMVLPGHTSKPVPFDQKILALPLATIKENLRVLKLPEDDFIKTVVLKIPPTPPNYLKISALNLKGNIHGEDFKEIEAGANRCAIS